MKNNNKKLKIYIAVVIISTELVISAISLAYFTQIFTDNPQTNVSADVSDLANLTFDQVGAITIDASLDNFTSTDGNLSSSATAIATLESEENYQAEYYLYFNILKNEFLYTSEEEYAELILTITGQNREVTTVEGLERTTSGGVSGFDVTKSEGLFEIAIEEDITTTAGNAASEEWVFTLYFINLDSNQNDNAGRSFNSMIVIQGEELSLLSDMILINSGEYSSVSDAITAITNKETPDYDKAVITEEYYNTLDEWCTNTDNTQYCSESYFTTTENGMYAIDDEYGISYYYRGAVDNNWVYFAGYYWRIIRIDGEGNIKMIYSGSTAPTESDAYTMTSSSTYISTSAFNSSDIILSYSNYLAKTMYCVDREAWTNSSYTDAYKLENLNDYESGTVCYAGYKRLLSSKIPSLDCSNTLDEIDLKIGLISADEVSLAGGRCLTYNYSYYLRATSTYGTLSPSYFVSSDSTARSFFVYTNGYLGTGFDVSFSLAARPTISLISGMGVISGTGAWNDPYVVD